MISRLSRVHYAWVVVAVTFFTLLFAAGVRIIPSVIIKPLEAEFGWDRSTVSFAVALSLFAYGFGGPIAGSLVDRYGPRRVMLGGLSMITLGLVPIMWMQNIWAFNLLWGLVVGIGTGVIANVLGATIANRWFNQRRGLVMGLLGASAAAGQLIFLPSAIALASSSGWRAVIGVIVFGVGVMLVPVLLLMRDRPSEVGLKPVGGDLVTASGAALVEPSIPLRAAVRTRDFWLLALSFFVCGYTTNGLIGTHLLPHTVEHGFIEVETAAALGLMGIMNIFGTLASGWATDRYDNRKLLAIYYGLRALSLVALPFIIEIRDLYLFAFIYGLDWVATVPPTVNLTARRFGRASLGSIYGWIFCSHMIGAGIAAQAGGIFRDLLGDYHLIFLSAAVLGLIASGLALSISTRRAAALVSQAA